MIFAIYIMIERRVKDDSKWTYAIGACVVGLLIFTAFYSKYVLDKQMEIRMNVREYASVITNKQIDFKKLTREDLGMSMDENSTTCPYKTPSDSECVVIYNEDGTVRLQEFERDGDERIKKPYYIMIIEHLHGKALAMMMDEMK